MLTQYTSLASWLQEMPGPSGVGVVGLYDEGPERRTRDTGLPQHPGAAGWLPGVTGMPEEKARYCRPDE